MKKKCNRRHSEWWSCLQKLFFMMRLISVFLFCLCLQLPAATYSQQVKISLDLENVSMLDVIREIRTQSGYRFFFNHNELKNVEGISVKVREKELHQVLQEVLGKENLGFREEKGVIIITPREAPVPAAPQVTGVKITGVVTSAAGEPLPGVSVVIKGTAIGVATDTEGKFAIEMGESAAHSLVFSFIGMKTVELKLVKNKTDYKVVLEDELTTLDDVVVTGFFTKNKNSFTGSVKSLNIEDIKSVSNTNLISAIAMMTPGLKLMENNQYGSDPNRLPEIVIRGTSSLATDADVASNQPIIILDGVEITLRDLYDIDINDIERVDVLKDASATALYGENAANGVIVIERKRILNDKLRLSYNLDGSVDVPDLNTYDYLDAADKLEFERLSGLYNFEQKDSYEEYNRKKLAIAQGVNTNWLSKPLRTGFSVNNSVGISGRGNSMTYRVNANIKNVHGVMKKDFRNTYGLSLFLSYHIDNKLTVSLQSSFSAVKSKYSPYGEFSGYVIANPYDLPEDEYGRLNKLLSWEIANPLFEAECGNYKKASTWDYQNSLTLRWDVMRNFFITATGSVKATKGEEEKFFSPESTKFKDKGMLTDKGSLTTRYSKGLDYSGNVVLNYNQQLGEENLLSLHVGGDIYKNSSIFSEFTGIGFYKPGLNTVNMAAGYPAGSHPSGEEELSTRLGFFANMNFIMKNRYFVDGSIRRSGSSKFGANNKYAPFWSVGAGWNLHNEMFLKRDWLSTLRLRYSYGVTGNVSFHPYQAITTYVYDSDNFYLHGIGALPKTMGNKNLTWQSTGMHNIGITADLFDNRLNLTLDYYIKTTKDMLVDMAIPPSVGEEKVKNNLGRMRNKGIELDLTALIYRNKDWRFSVRVNAAHNENKILAISSGLIKHNSEATSEKSVAPRILYKAGESSTAIYAVRSAGINPATGEEVFIKKNGAYTLEYDAADKVVVGDETPFLEGAIFPLLSFRRWSLNMSLQYRFGGQIYNTTRVKNVENVDPRYNVDRRAFEQRWKKVNDIPPYLDIANQELRSGRHSSRFVEDDNTLEFKRIEVAYEFDTKKLMKIGMKRLRLGVAVNEPFRLSTVKYERGTAYPFSRGFAFSISPTF